MNMLASFTRSFAASTLQSDARRAALVLHALQESDRAWLLDRLEASHRDLLSGLLDELRQLGLPADAALLDEAVRAATHRATGGLSDADLDLADPRLLAHVLALEPPALIARLIRIRSWRWADALLSQLGPMQQIKVRKLLAESEPPGSVPSLLETQLLRHLQRRLEVTELPAPKASDERARSSSAVGAMWSRVLRRRLA